MKRLSLVTRLGTILLVAVLLQAPYALADSLPDKEQTADREFREFWRGGLDQLEQTVPGYHYGQNHCLLFVGLDGRLRQAWYDVPTVRTRAAVVHITDSPEALPVTGCPDRARYAFAWSQSLPTTALPADPRQHPLYRAILDTVRLVQIVTSVNGNITGAVGLIGEGYGASIALAVAGLLPSQVDFVVAHQPICLRPALLMGLQVPPGQRGAVARAAVSRMLDPRSFAAQVRARCLVTCGSADPYATPESVKALHQALATQAELWELVGIGHCPVDQVPGLWRAWQAWAFGPSEAGLQTTSD